MREPLVVLCPRQLTLVPQLNKHIVLLLNFLCSVGHFMITSARKPRDLVPVVIDYRVTVVSIPCSLGASDRMSISRYV